jgi:diacylglycerol kinase family enzyme
MFAAASRGTHERFGEVTIQRAAAFSLSFAEAPVFERDGELQRAHTRDVTVECLPRALNVVAGRNFA